MLENNNYVIYKISKIVLRMLVWHVFVSKKINLIIRACSYLPQVMKRKLLLETLTYFLGIVCAVE